MNHKADAFVLSVMVGLFLLAGAVISLVTDDWTPLLGFTIAIAIAASVIALMLGLCRLAEKLFPDDK